MKYKVQITLKYSGMIPNFYMSGLTVRTEKKEALN